MSAFAPSQVAIDAATGARYRKCAAAAIVDACGRLLVGERVKIPGAWNAPQGGMDAEPPETARAAASREAYEEVGLRAEAATGEPALMVFVAAQESDDEAVRYKAGGWLAEAGFAGQQLHWALFFTSDARLDADPSRICRLEGLGGEAPEFSAVRFAPLEGIIADMWPAKRAPYERLRDWARPLIARRDAACAAVDFRGLWSRDAAKSQGMFEALLARGTPADIAARKAAEPYVQRWEAADEALEWHVTTFAADGVTPRRRLHYPLGDWDEQWEHGSTLFGADEGVVHRLTVYLAEPEADLQVAHSTFSPTPIGEEEARRYIRGEHMILRRTFWPASGGDAVVSTEVFVRQTP